MIQAAKKLWDRVTGNPAPPARKLLSWGETCKLIGIPSRGLRRWISLGRLKPIHARGGKLVFNRSEVLEAVLITRDTEPGDKSASDESMG